MSTQTLKVGIDRTWKKNIHYITSSTNTLLFSTYTQYNSQTVIIIIVKLPCVLYPSNSIFSINHLYFFSLMHDTQDYLLSNKFYILAFWHMYNVDQNKKKGVFSLSSLQYSNNKIEESVTKILYRNKMCRAQGKHNKKTRASICFTTIQYKLNCCDTNYIKEIWMFNIFFLYCCLQRAKDYLLCPPSKMKFYTRNSGDSK